ncbi:MAG TPA: SOS response-associated peptidase [Terrimesophilobacter sp.]|nr:SOS response-associated peptidase [Terrimesophilobacter sp.]
MCGRYALDDHINALIEEFVASGGDYSEWVPAYSIAPTNRAPIVRERSNSDGEVIRSLDLAGWGLKPAWAKPGGPAPINARMETLASNGMFRGAFSGQRCLVPMSGYFEWTDEPDGKQPHYIHSAHTLAAAGLYAARNDGTAPDGTDSWKITFTIATREATDASGQVHDRMPVFLQREVWADWLNPAKFATPGAPDPAALQALMDESSLAVAATLRAHAVDRRLNSTRTLDRLDPTLLDPVEE